MKVFVALACLIVCVSANGWNPQLSSGTSQSSRTQDSAGNYAFSYNEQHATGGSSRSESGNGWGAQGSYSLNVGDGRKRVVKYVADGAGFRAAISTNEPGTAALPAASTSIASPYAPPQPVQPLPAPVLVAPVAAPAPLVSGWGAPAPIALPAPAPIALPAPAPAVLSGWGAPAPIAVAVKAVPAVSSYSTSINHVAPIVVKAIPAPIVTSGWGAPAPIALPAPAPLPALKAW